MHVRQILIIEWIIFHVMAHAVKECLGVVKSPEMSLRINSSVLTTKPMQLVIVRIVDNCYKSFADMCQNTCNWLKSIRM